MDHLVDRSKSKLFTPLRLGAVELSHRVVLAPLTRNRGRSSKTYANTWYPDTLNVHYYSQRTTPGGLLISEAVPISRTSGSLGAPGIFTTEQFEGWRRVVAAIHEKSGFIFCQLWHQGRVAHSRLTYLQPWSASSVPIQGGLHRANGYEPVPYEPPHAMTKSDIQEVYEEYLTAAKKAMDCGFDGVEIHAANGYLPDQFHHSNINLRTDEYGGTPENRCRFTLELAQKLCNAIGSDRVGVRLAPFGLFNETRGQDRQYQWTYLCSKLSELGLAYIHLIEPRFDELRPEAEKLATLNSLTPGSDASLKPYREAIKAPTRCIVAGGYYADNCWDGIERGDHDAVAFGRYFTSNEDLVERLRTGQPLYRYDRAWFYGPFESNEIGYTVHVKREFADETDVGQAQNVDPATPIILQCTADV